MKMENKLKKLAIKSLFILALGVLLLLPKIALLETTPPAGGTESAESAARRGLGTAASDTGLQGRPGISQTVGTVITAIIGFVGIIFLVLIIAGGLMWMTAGGAEEKIGKATKLMVNSTIGIILVMLSYAIVNFVMNKIGA